MVEATDGGLLFEILAHRNGIPSDQIPSVETHPKINILVDVRIPPTPDPLPHIPRINA